MSRVGGQHGWCISVGGQHVGAVRDIPWGGSMWMPDGVRFVMMRANWAHACQPFGAPFRLA